MAVLKRRLILLGVCLLLPVAFMPLVLADAQQSGEAAAQKLLLRASADNTQEQINMGIMYLRGRDVEANPEQAFYWMEKAAQNGSAEAEYYLSLFYEDGLGVNEPDLALAMKWLRQAADHDYAYASYELGLAYLAGKIGSVDAQQGALWLDKAAREGVVRAQRQLASLYEQGIGVAQNTDSAMYWYRQAGSRGDEGALKALRSLQN
ncbi:MAG: sel1 repeat family protein [Neisseriaceae bacterium]|nr:sel1 repeat family protein [Neisseriaceae bacterium]MBP6863434.1 sel1 repeat family protein [Neisseriaceae bacterium]